MIVTMDLLTILLKYIFTIMKEMKFDGYEKVIKLIDQGLKYKEIKCHHYILCLLIL